MRSTAPAVSPQGLWLVDHIYIKHTYFKMRLANMLQEFQSFTVSGNVLVSGQQFASCFNSRPDFVA
jgi:hypothetical protein